MNKLLYWIKNELRYYHIYFYYGVRNIVSYLPVIWYDRSWGPYYTLSILKRKLEITVKDVTKYDRTIGCERDVERMNTVIRLIDKIKDEVYGMEYLDYVVGDFWSEKETFDDQSYQDFQNKQDYTKFFEKYPLIYKKFKCDDDSNTHIALSIGLENDKRAKKLLYKILYEHLDSFGD